MTIHVNYFYLLSLMFTVLRTVVPETDPIAERMFDGIAVSAYSIVSVDATVLGPWPMLLSRLKCFEDGSKISACWFLRCANVGNDLKTIDYDHQS